MDAFDVYGPSSQALTFLDPEDNDLIGGETQDVVSNPHLNLSQEPHTRANHDLKHEFIEDIIEENDADSQNDIETDGDSGNAEHACSYCGVSDPACVVLCNKTQKWFCNGSGSNSSSHIVTHLVRSRSSEVKLHKDGPLGDTLLECYVCGAKNVFVLGFVPARSESVVVLLCRTMCVNQNKDMNWDPSQWQPIIQERQFLNWLVKFPSDEDQLKAKSISAAKISELEKSWDSLVHYNLIEDEQVVPARLVYDDVAQYISTYSPLIALEEAYNKRLVESTKAMNVSIRWEHTLSGCYAYFQKPDFAVLERPVTVTDFLYFQKENKKYKGTVIKVPDYTNEDYVVEVEANDVTPTANDNYTVGIALRTIVYDRINQALMSIEKNLPPYLLKRLLGHNIDDVLINCKLPKHYSVSGLPELNHSQVFAVKACLQQPLSVIQGPPGTGKTVTSASIVYHLNRIHKSKILVVAPNNIAVDHLCEKISLTGLRVVRFYARSRESIVSPISHLALHIQAQQVKGNRTLDQLRKLKAETGELSSKDRMLYRSIVKKVGIEILKNSDVICCTCVSARDRRIAQQKFHTVLVDEATQAYELECLVPISVGCQQLILVGDHCQLGPIVSCQKAAISGLKRSLFERLVLIGIRPLRLKVQYRMHPALAFFPSNVFYDGSLQNGVTADDRAPKIKFPWPDEEIPSFFYCTTGQEEISASGTSYLNRSEVSTIEKFITKLLKAGVDPKEIGIITPYAAQQAYLAYYLRFSGSLNSMLYTGIEIASVEQFQGREKRFVIISCVRSNRHQGIGFLKDPRRLNVSLTRAQSGLIIVGDPKTLCHYSLWNELLHFYRERHILVEGSLNNFTEHMLQFPKNSVAYKFNLTKSTLDTADAQSNQMMNTLYNYGLLQQQQQQQQAAQQNGHVSSQLLRAMNAMSMNATSSGVNHAAAYALAAAAAVQQQQQQQNPASMWLDKVYSVGPNRQFASASAKWRFPMPLGMIMPQNMMGRQGEVNGRQNNMTSGRMQDGVSLPPDSSLNAARGYSRMNNRVPNASGSNSNRDGATRYMGSGPRASGNPAMPVTNNSSDLLSQPGLSEMTGTQGSNALMFNSQTRGMGLSGLSQDPTLDLGVHQAASQMDNLLLSQDSTFQDTGLMNDLKQRNSNPNSDQNENAFFDMMQNVGSNASNNGPLSQF